MFRSEKPFVRFTSVPSGDASIDFVDKRPMLAATVAVFATAALLLAGDGMTPVWPLMWIAFLPVLLLAVESNSWRVAAGAAALSMLLGSLNLLYFMHFVQGLR